MYGFIYITTNIITGKRYLGKKIYSSNHANYLGSGTSLREDILILGRDKFSREIIDYGTDPKDLKEKELLYIRKFNCVESDDWYNQFPRHNTNGFTGKHHSEETKAQMRKSYKRILTPEGSQRLSEAVKRDKRWMAAAAVRKTKIGALHKRSIPVIVDNISYEFKNLAFQANKNKYTQYDIDNFWKIQNNIPIKEKQQKINEVELLDLFKLKLLNETNWAFCQRVSSNYNSTPQAIKYALKRHNLYPSHE